MQPFKNLSWSGHTVLQKINKNENLVICVGCMSIFRTFDSVELSKVEFVK